MLDASAFNDFVTRGEFVRNTPTGPQYRRPVPHRLPKGAKTYRVHERFPHKPLVTTGRIATDAPAIVYAAATRDGRIKIGMTARESRRMRDLSARLVFAVEVVTEAAKEVETHALRQFGHRRGDGEYVARITPVQAAEAILEAFRIVGAYRHVDPKLTAEQARQARIRTTTSA